MLQLLAPMWRVKQDERPGCGAEQEDEWMRSVQEITEGLVKDANNVRHRGHLLDTVALHAMT